MLQDLKLLLKSGCPKFLWTAPSLNVKTQDAGPTENNRVNVYSGTGLCSLSTY